MPLPEPSSPSIARKASPGFTITELLVVLVILLILLGLILSAVFGAHKRARRTQCMANLKGLHTLCMTYALEHEGRVPPSNTTQPSSLKRKHRDALKVYMEEEGLIPEIWYCPAIGIERPDFSRKSWEENTYEINIGYVYLGNPTQDKASYGKFVQNPPYEGSARIMPNQVLAADFNAADTEATIGKDVEEWRIFPHDGKNDPKVSHRLLGDGSVHTIHVQQVEFGYLYSSGVKVFW